MDDDRLTPLEPVGAPHEGAQAQKSPRALGFEFPTGNDPQSVRRRVEATEAILERSMVLPGTSYRIGLDTIVGLVPVVGDFITAAMGAYIVWEARNLGIPKWKLWHMAGRIGFDTALGAGGMEFAGPWGVVVAPNITSGEDGIASYTDDELKAMITQGIRPDGGRMLPPMPYHHFALMTPDDLDAVVLYLRSLPPMEAP